MKTQLVMAVYFCEAFLTPMGLQSHAHRRTLLRHRPDEEVAYVEPVNAILVEDILDYHPHTIGVWRLRTI